MSAPAHAQQVAAPVEAAPVEAAPVEAAPVEVEAPRVFGDVGLRTKLWPRTGTMLLGPTLGVVVRPFGKCMHIGADLFAGFADVDVPGVVAVSPEGLPVLGNVDGSSQLYSLSFGMLWGNGDADHWMGAGAVLEGGYAHLEVGPDEDSGLALDLSLRAQLRHQLRDAAWVYVELRVGHTLLDQDLTFTTAESPRQFGPVLALAIGATLGP